MKIYSMFSPNNNRNVSSCTNDANAKSNRLTHRRLVFLYLAHVKNKNGEFTIENHNTTE